VGLLLAGVGVFLLETSTGACARAPTWSRALAVPSLGRLSRLAAARARLLPAAASPARVPRAPFRTPW